MTYIWNCDKMFPIAFLDSNTIEVPVVPVFRTISFLWRYVPWVNCIYPLSQMYHLTLVPLSQQHDACISMKKTNWSMMFMFCYISLILHTYLLLIPCLIMVLQDFFMNILSSSIMAIIVFYTFLLFSPESNVPPEPSKLADWYAGCESKSNERQTLCSRQDLTWCLNS